MAARLEAGQAGGGGEGGGRHEGCRPLHVATDHGWSDRRIRLRKRDYPVAGGGWGGKGDGRRTLRSKAGMTLEGHDGSCELSIAQYQFPTRRRGIWMRTGSSWRVA